MPIDLHCHTEISDGSVGVDELIVIAKRMGIKNLAITDHDTFAGAKRGSILGSRHGVNVIVGAEFSSFCEKMNKEIHILCYMCEYPDRLEGICSHNSKARKDANLKIVDKLMEIYPISHSLVLARSRGSSGIFKNHIVQAVIDSGCVLPVYSLVYKKLFMKDSNFVQAEFCSPSDVIFKIHQSGGLAILAHPKESDLTDVIPYLIGLEIDGVEVYHPNVSPNYRDKLIEMSMRYGLITTGGSDFHGMYSAGARPLNSFTTSDTNINLMLEKKNTILRRYNG